MSPEPITELTEIFLFQELAFLGHGRLMELTNEQEFFTTCKDSNKVVCHFYEVASRMSPLVDEALEKLSTKYFYTRFVKVNAEKVNPFSTYFPPKK